MAQIDQVRTVDRSRRKLAWYGLALVASASLLPVGGTAHAANAARGAELYMRTDFDIRSCVSCHGPDPGSNHNNILRAADQPVTLTKVLNTVGAMAFLGSQLSDPDRADVTAFLGSITRLNAPGAGLRMWPVTLDFGAAPPGGSSTVQTIRLDNPAVTATVGIGPIRSSDGSLQLTHDCPAQLAPKTGCNIQAQLRPTARGMARASIDVSTTAFTAPLHAGVYGAGKEGPLSQLVWQSGSTVQFDQANPVASIRRVISLFNPGPMPSVLGLTSIVGPDASRFKIESGCTQGSVLQAGTGCELTLAYSPGLLPLAQAVLQTRSDQGNPGSLALQGVGIAATPPSAIPVEQMLESGSGGGGCSAGPPDQKSWDPMLTLMALLAAIAAMARSRRRR